MPNQLNQIPIGTRMWFATIGIIAGNVVLLLYLMGAAAYMRAWLLRVHMGEPQLQFEQYWDGFLLCAVFSIVGWVVVGIPVAIVFPARLLAHRSWPVLGLLIGITLGPVALLLVFIEYLALEGGLRAASFDQTEVYWVFSIKFPRFRFWCTPHCYAGGSWPRRLPLRQPPVDENWRAGPPFLAY